TRMPSGDSTDAITPVALRNVGDSHSPYGAGAGGGGAVALLVGGRKVPTARPRLALRHDPQEHVLQRRRRVAERLQRAAVLLNHRLEVAPQRVGDADALRPQLDPLLVFEQSLHFAQFLQLAVVEDGDAVAD